MARTSAIPVSYTHLDVYKRQVPNKRRAISSEITAFAAPASKSALSYGLPDRKTCIRDSCYAGNRIQHIHQSLATPDDGAAVERIALFLRWFLWSARKLECRFNALQQGGIIPGDVYKRQG